MSAEKGARRYHRSECVSFRRTDEPFGGLSNMAPGYPVRVNGIRVMTIEALYQAARFPHLPDVQRLIIDQHSPMTAKMVSKPRRKDSRQDWDNVRTKVMRWCLRLKLSQHWSKFSQLLLSTGDRPIVEDSRKDDFWGAISSEGDTLVGLNVLGRLLMELREEIKAGAELRRTEPPAIHNFQLFGEPLQVVDFRPEKNASSAATTVTGDACEGLSLPLFEEAPAAPRNTALAHRSVAERQRGMMEALKPYAEFKESGLPWLGRCPKDWSVRRTKILFHERVQKGFPNEPLLAATQTKGVVKKEDYETRTVTAQKDLHLLKLVEIGDYVISLRSFQGGIEVAHCRGIISPAYTVLKPRKQATSGYYSHFFKAKPFIDSLSLFVTGIREGQNIDYERLSRAELPMPSDDEQVAIVRFLDHANRKIDGFIRAKRKLIALLGEQKQTIINRAVTRGLNPEVPLKPSGIPWLGDIPKHWQVRPIKQLLARMDYGISESSVPNGKIRVLTMGHIQRGRVIVPESGGVNEIPLGLALEPEDLLFNRTNSPELVGKVGLFTSVQDTPITFASYLVRLRVRPEHSPYWLNYLLNSFPFWAFARSQALVSLHQANLNSSRYGRMSIPVPSRNEQDGIVAEIKNDAGGVETAIARTEREIALMQEYRTRLTADVVTGKLDVREAAAKLPDLPSETVIADPDDGTLAESLSEDLEAKEVD